MTRDEFFTRRAVMHHERTEGVTQCPPAAAPPSQAVTARRAHQKKIYTAGFARTKTPKLDDESGDALPSKPRPIGPVAR